MWEKHSFFIFKLLLLLIIVNGSIAYGQNFNNCLSSINSDKATVITWPYLNEKKLLNDNHWLTPKQLIYQSLKEIVWVDIRSNAEKKIIPLIDTIDLSVIELANANFLFNRNIVLVGTGFDQLAIDQAISLLTKKGFKHIYALEGGVRVWEDLKQQKLGLIDEISAEQFLLGSKTIPWKVITIGLTDQEIAILPEKPFKQFDISKKSFKEIAQLMEDKHAMRDQFISLVLVASDTKNLQQLKRQLQPNSFSKQAVWLQGGLHSYQKYIEQQHKVIASKGSSLSKPCGINF